MFNRHLNGMMLLATVVVISGCATTATSNTARTAKEQMLLSNAVDQSLNKVDFTPMYNQKVFVEEKFLECVDKPYVVGSIRHRVLRSGGVLVDKAEDATIVMEMRSGGVGTDTAESYLGTPEIALPGMLTIPEIRVAEKKSQYGYAKLGLVIYDAQTKRVLGEGGMALAEADDHNWYVAGIGPFQDGSLKGDQSQAKSRSRSMYNRQLPTTVAFGTPSGLNDDATIQFASDSKPAE